MEIEGNLKKIRDCVWEIPSSYKKDMRVPARIYLNDEAIKEVEIGAVDQVSNVACLPGIQKFSIGLPDIHFRIWVQYRGSCSFQCSKWEL